jgi:hypothetical protein
MTTDNTDSHLNLPAQIHSKVLIVWWGAWHIDIALQKAKNKEVKDGE